MNKTQLTSSIAEETNVSKVQVKKILESMLKTIVFSLKNGKNVQIAGFGTFKVHNRAARIGRNPQTGEKINIAATKVPTFISGKAFKIAIK
ncbi:DNA-binding protein HU-alpha [Buchnera aphidicola (Anoecia corni)]|uniref:DNA-binding protein HU-alpha n=1 Tax=Buchnera aphidicola (Anoecia corni) TaxID=2994477 RepID=A0AAT9IHL0_9GAMM